MKKIRYIPLGLAFVVGNLAFAADEIHYTITGKNSITFDWHGTASENSIGFGLSPSTYSQVKAKAPNPVPSSSQGSFWEAKLTGLKANTLYYYSIGNGPARTFRTVPLSGSSGFTVYAQGDIGETSDFFNMGINQDLIANGKPAFVIGLGDLTLGNSFGKAAVDQHFNDVMIWSKEAAYMPVWGDQDWLKTSKDNFSNYKGRFDLPNPQTSPGTPLAGGEDWYWFDYGNVRFIALPEPWTGAWANWKTKAATLMAQAQADNNIKFIVTMAHRPAYSSGHYPGSATLKGIMDSLGDRYSKYRLNINSHSRNYERSHPQHGVVHITAGIGGANLLQDGTCLWLTCAKPKWSAFRAMHLGALKLQFAQASIKGSFICGPAGGGRNDLNCKKGNVIDNFTIASTSVAVPAASKAVVATSSSKAVQVAAAAAVTSTGACSKVALNVSGATSDGGYAYLVRKSFGIPADTETAPTRSTLRFFENGVEMGSAHSLHANIRNIGLGRFSHKSLPDGASESIRFSASNNSNPKTNGKSYSYCLKTTNIPTPTPKPAATPTPTPTPSVPTPASASSSCAPAPTSTLVVNVKDTGATGNGSTNDTAAIQAAINQVAGKGGTVLVPNGTYMIDAVTRLLLKSNMTLRMTSGAVLKAKPNNQNHHGIIKIDKASNVNVIGGKVQGERDQHVGDKSGEFGMGIEIYGASNVVIEGVAAVDMWGEGFYVDEKSSKITFCSVVADNNRRNGLSIISADGVVVKNSIFRNTNGRYPYTGLDIEPDHDSVGVNNVQILNSSFYGNQGSGIQSSYDNASRGGPTTNVNIDGNIIYKNGRSGGTNSAGITLSEQIGVKVTNNIVKDNTHNGVIVVIHSQKNVVTGNTVTNNGGKDPNYSNEGFGILLDLGDDTANDKTDGNIIMNNTVTGNHQGIVTYPSKGNNTVGPNK